MTSARPTGFAVTGFTVGHWSHPAGTTGCSVLIADAPTLAVVDVRGGAPGTRELALLGPGRLVQHIDAILLTGGSAFGLAAADGVMRWLRERGRGFPTASIPVPIVAGAVLFDLQGENPVWPDPDAGYAAAARAVGDGWVSGRFGAGTGATVAKLHGRAVPSGIGAWRQETPFGTVAALVAVNAFGDVVDPVTGRSRTVGRDQAAGSASRGAAGENTTIGVVVLDGEADRDTLVRMAIAAHDGLARAIRPAHTIFDGDTIFAVARSAGAPAPEAVFGLALASEDAVSRAILSAVDTDMHTAPSES